MVGLPDRSHDADIERLWNQGVDGTSIAEHLGIGRGVVSKVVLLRLRVPYAEWVKRRRPPVEDIPCAHCGTMFAPACHGRQRFCSKRCGVDSRRPLRTPEEEKSAQRKAVAYLRISSRQAAEEHFEWARKEKLRKAARRA